MKRRQPSEDEIVLADNLDVLPGLEGGSFQLAYLDPRRAGWLQGRAPQLPPARDLLIP